nr:tail fiber assembly protein [Pseudomonas gingeri]
MIAEANAQINTLLASAGLRVAPLQDAVDLGTATDDDTANLKLWKEYHVALRRLHRMDSPPQSTGQSLRLDFLDQHLHP